MYFKVGIDPNDITSPFLEMDRSTNCEAVLNSCYSALANEGDGFVYSAQMAGGPGGKYICRKKGY